MSLHFIDVLIGLSVVLGGLSLIVTLLVQAVGAFLALRGSNLRWGIETMLVSINGVSLNANAREIAEHVLRHPMVSGSILMTTGDTVWAKLLRGLSSIPGVGALHRRWTLAKAIRVEEIVPIMRTLVGEGGALEPWQTDLKALLDAGAPAIGQIRGWFDGAMDRVTERFATRTRIVAIAASFVLAMALHVDVLRILSAVSVDAGLRASLLTAAGEMSKRDLGREEADRVRAALAPIVAREKLSEPPPDLRSVEEGQAWLVKTTPDATREALRQELARTVVQTRLQALERETKALTDSPVWGALDLWPIQPRHVWADLFCGDDALSHLLGTLFGGALLSLGAPFWFNMLKSLMTLRPPLAERAERERAARG